METPGAPGFTGATLADREQVAGLDRADFWLSEGVGGVGTAAAIIEAHIGTVYHRSGLLTPAGRYFGIADADGAASHVVIESLATNGALNGATALAPAVYPGRGQTGVPGMFSPLREQPDPVPSLAAAGYPVSVHFPRVQPPYGSEPAATGALTLATAAGVPVDGILITPATDSELARSDVFLVPQMPLVSGTTYVATADLSYGDQRLTTEWSFTVR
jgi:hypothetical protein